jgi:gas vesicle protein
MSEKGGGFQSYFAGFLIGGLVGAAVALIMAPRSGRETREEILVRSGEVRDRAEDTVDEAVMRLRAVARDVSARAEELRAQSATAFDEGQRQLARAMEETRKTAEEAVEEIRRVAVEAVNETRKAAVERTKA